MNSCEKLLNWEQLWFYLVQDEISWNTIDGTLSKGGDEEKTALYGKEMNGKQKNSQSKPESNQGGKKKYFSKIKCLHCHEFRKYATKCPHKKERKNTLRGVASEALASQFELDLTLISCMACTVMGRVWYLDSIVLFHMTRCRDLFSDLEKKYL